MSAFSPLPVLRLVFPHPQRLFCQLLVGLFGVLAVLGPDTGLRAQSAAPDPTELLRRVDRKSRGESARSTMSIETIRPEWSRTMELKSWSQGNDQAMLLITAPARDRGIVYLKSEREVWNWLPSIERSVKLPPSMMAQDWMGTDFTNDDLVRESSMVTDYTHELLGRESVDGIECWKIRMTPKPDAAVVWSYVLTWVDPNNETQVQSQFFDEDEELVSTLRFSDVRDLGGRLLPAVMEMQPADKPGQKTVIRTQSIEFDVEHPARFFTVANMRRLRD
jgi:hypothetical protein